MNSPAFDVIVCGSLHLDIMLYAPSLPRPDETVAGTRWEQQCGGKGGNQAVQAARAGARTAMIGRVGPDDFGTRLRRNLVEAAVDASAVGVEPEAGSGMSAAIVRDDGDYSAVIVSGSNLRIDPEGFEMQWRALGGARVLVLQNEVPEPVNVEAAKVARASGARVILNAAPARTMSGELLDRVDVLIVNRMEAEMLSGVEIVDHTTAVVALLRLSAPFAFPVSPRRLQARGRPSGATRANEAIVWRSEARRHPPPGVANSGMGEAPSTAFKTQGNRTNA